MPEHEKDSAGSDSTEYDAARAEAAPEPASQAPDDTASQVADGAVPDGNVIHDGSEVADGRAAIGGGDAGDSSPEMVRPEAHTRAERRTVARRSERDPVRATIRGLGQLLITAGLVVLLFVAYELWVTNLFGEAKQAQATSKLDQLWAQESDTVSAPDPSVITQPGGVVVSTAAAPTLAPGERTRQYNTTEGVGFAKIYIPSFGADFMFTIVEGTNQHDLYAGPGHYDKTQYPGEEGNFALAGHRVNKGAPFDDLGLLQSCDAIVIETQSEWYVYRMLPQKDEVATWADTAHAHCAGVSVQTGKYKGVYGQEITTPADIAQVYPVPHVDNTVVPAGAERLITLTTCHPKFSDRQRMIIHGVLTASYPKADGFVPPEMQEVG
ncbi:MAG: class E sortase [Nakamurella sp.]